MDRQIWSSLGHTPRAISLTRVSVDPKFESTSHETQHEANLRCIEELGAILVKHYKETVSGALYNARIETQQALEDLENDRADYLVLYSMDRYGRSMRWQQEILSRIERAEKRVQFATFRLEYDERDNRLTIWSRSAFNTFGNVSEQERFFIADRTGRGKRKKVENGIQVARSLSPLGYHIVRKADVIREIEPKGSEGQYRVVEAEADLPPLIFEKYIAMKSYRGVASWLNTHGYRTRGGALWQACSVTEIIRNPVYKGEPAYGRTRRRIDESRADRGLGMKYYTKVPEQDWITLSAPALVTPELWAEANRISEVGRAERSGRPCNDYLLTGFVFCPQCARRMYAVKLRSKFEKDPTAHAFECCGKSRRTPQHSQRCNTGTFRGNILNQLVIAALTQFLQEPDSITKEVERYRKEQSRNSERQKTKAHAQKLRKEIDQLKKREQAAADMAVEARVNGGNSALYEQSRRNAESKRQALEAQLDLLESAQQAEVITQPQYGDIAELACKALNSPDTPFQQKRDFIESLVERIYPIRAEETNMPGVNRLYKTGGVALVLRSARPGPCFVLRNTITKRSGYAHITDTKLEYSIYPRDPYQAAAEADSGSETV